jgi:hypothetical protein
MTPQQAASARMTIRTFRVPGSGPRVAVRETLQCEPPAGSVPDPPRACEALQDFLTHFRPPKREVQFCGKRSKTHRIVEVWATVDGQKVGLVGSDLSGECGLRRRLRLDLDAIVGNSDVATGVSAE